MKKLMISITLALSAFANPQNNILDLSLEDLMNIKLTTGTWVEKTIEDTPASVYVYPRSTMDNYKIYTIRDLANITPGYSSYLYLGERTITSRGIKSSGFDSNYHLILIDGIEVNHGRNNRALIEEELSLFGAKQVEFLNGPASAIYGTGSMLGVINIKSLTPSKDQVISRQRINYGTNHTLDIHNIYAKNNEAYKFNIQFSYHQNESSNQKAGGNDETWRNQNDTKNSYVNSSVTFNKGIIKGLKLGSIILDRNSGMGPGFFTNKNGYHESNSIFWNTTILFADHTKKLSSSSSLKSQLTSNRSRERSYYGQTAKDKFVNYDIIVQSYGAKSTYLKQERDFSFLLGAQYNIKWREGQPDSFSYDSNPSSFSNEYLKNDSDKLKTYSLFTQVTKKFNFYIPWETTIGLRSDKTDSSTSDFNQLSPRLAFVGTLKESLKLHLLYATALRAPDLKTSLINRQRIDTNVANNQPVDEIPKNLEAENLKNYELKIAYTSYKFFVSTSLFYNERKDVFGQEKRNDQFVYFNQDGKSKSYGVEYQINYIDKGYEFFLNSAYAKSETPTTDYFSDVPVMTNNLGVTLKPSDSSFKYSTILRNTTGYRTENNENNFKGNTFVDFNVDYRFSKDSSIDLRIKNLLNHEAHHPNGGAEGDPLPKRSILLSFNTF